MFLTWLLDKGFAMFSFEDILLMSPTLASLWFVLARQDKTEKMQMITLVAIFFIQSIYLGSKIDFQSFTGKSDVELRVEKILNHHSLPLPVVKDSGWSVLVNSYKRSVLEAVVAGREYPDQGITEVLGRMRAYNAEAAHKLNVPNIDVILRKRIEQRDRYYAECVENSLNASTCPTTIYSMGSNSAFIENY